MGHGIAGFTVAAGLLLVATQAEASGNSSVTRNFIGTIASGDLLKLSGPVIDGQAWLALDSRTDMTGSAFRLSLTTIIDANGFAIENGPLSLVVDGVNGFSASVDNAGGGWSLTISPSRDNPEYISYWNSGSGPFPAPDLLNYDGIGAFISATRRATQAEIDGNGWDISVYEAQDFVPLTDFPKIGGLPDPGSFTFTRNRTDADRQSATQLFGTFVPNVTRFTVTVTPLSAGVIPEPASWALMIAGFGLVGGAMRRQRGRWIA